MKADVPTDKHSSVVNILSDLLTAQKWKIRCVMVGG